MRPSTVEITQKLQRFIDGRYALGGCNGWDCLSIILDFYRDFSVPIPEEFKSFTRENYAERWSAGEGRSELREFLFSLGQPVEKNYALIADLMIFQEESENIFGAVYLGNGHVLCAFPKGIRVVPFRYYERLLIGVRRCIF